MTIEQLDLIFPFFVLAYGALVTAVTHIPALIELAETRMPPVLADQLKLHQGLALVCLVVGGIWSLQNIWLT